jgi:tetratricopeptide (TPR) repeat protein
MRARPQWVSGRTISRSFPLQRSCGILPLAVFRSQEGSEMRFKDSEAAALYFRNRPGTAAERLAVAEHGFSLRYRDPVAMRAWCDAALVGLPPEADAKTAAMLHGYAGNAHRVVGEFESAEALLNRGLVLDPGEPRLLEFKASLLHDLHRLKEACAALSQAAALRDKQQDPLLHAATLVQNSMILDRAELWDEAASVVLKAVRIIADHSPSKEGEELLRSGLQNVALYLTNSARPREALQVLQHSRLFLARGGIRAEVRVEWILARIAGALGEESARGAFEAVRERCAGERMLQEVALISLDLARHLLEMSPLEARAEVAVVGPILAEIGIPEDSQEVRLLKKILEATQPDVDLLCELSRLLYRQRKFWASPV